MIHINYFSSSKFEFLGHVRVLKKNSSKLWQGIKPKNPIYVPLDNNGAQTIEELRFLTGLLICGGYQSKISRTVTLTRISASFDKTWKLFSRSHHLSRRPKGLASISLGIHPVAGPGKTLYFVKTEGNYPKDPKVDEYLQHLLTGPDGYCILDTINACVLT